MHEDLASHLAYANMHEDLAGHLAYANMHEDLVGHGVTVVTPPFDGPFGRTFAFADPDRYTITLHG